MFLLSVRAEVPRVVVASVFLILKLLVACFQKGPIPSQCPVTHFPQPDGKIDCSLLDSSSTIFLKIMPDVLYFFGRSCSSKSRSLVPLLASWRIRCLLSNVRPLGAPLAKLFVHVPWRRCPLLAPGTARRVIRQYTLYRVPHLSSSLEVTLLFSIE